MASFSSALETRLRFISDELCCALFQVLSEALSDARLRPASSTHTAQDRQRRTQAASQMRPVQLTQRLGLNKSLASRVVRALQESDALQALCGIPTPQGLHLISRAAESEGAGEAALTRLAASTNAYSQLLAEFSGGRTDLEATLAGWIPDLRARAERDARRSVFRGMTTLAGTRGSANYHSIYLVPNTADPNRVDSLFVTVRQDARRLQHDAEIVAMRLVTDETGNWRARRRTLQGDELGDDPRRFLVPELCSSPIPQLELNNDEPGTMVVRVAPDSLDVNEFTTFGLGWRTEAHFPRTADETTAFGSVVIGSSKPVEALVVDLFIHEDLGITGAPFTSLSRAVAPVPRSRHVPPALGSRERARGPRVIDLDAHPSGLASRDVRSCKAIAENVCREAGVELARFAKYRTRVEFPVTGEEVSLWWALPEGG